jgi:hypothetical protein
MELEQAGVIWGQKGLIGIDENMMYIGLGKQLPITSLVNDYVMPWNDSVHFAGICKHIVDVMGMGEQNIETDLVICNLVVQKSGQNHLPKMLVKKYPTCLVITKLSQYEFDPN